MTKQILIRSSQIQRLDNEAPRDGCDMTLARPGHITSVCLHRPDTMLASTQLKNSKRSLVVYMNRAHTLDGY